MVQLRKYSGINNSKHFKNKNNKIFENNILFKIKTNESMFFKGSSKPYEIQNINLLST